MSRRDSLIQSMRHGVLGHVLVLMSWTALAQVVSIGMMFLLPRLFTPGQFGVFSVFSGLVVAIGIVAAARYEFAIGLPASQREGAALFTLCVGMAGLVAATCLVAFRLLPSSSGLLAKFSGVHAWRDWAAIGIACMAWYNAAGYLALRSGSFAAVGKSKVVIAVVTAAGQLMSVAVVDRAEGWLIVPFVAGQACGVLVILYALWDEQIWNLRLADISAVARRFVRFPMMIAPGSLLDGIAVFLPVALLTAMFSPRDAGIYALAERALRVPITFVGSSVLQVLYKKLADLRGDPATGRRFLLRTWLVLGSVGLLPCIVIAMYGDTLFSLVFGDRWQESGKVARILVISMFFLFVSYPASNILVVHERARSFLLWQVVQIMFVGGALGLAAAIGSTSIEATVAILVAGQLLVYLFSMYLQWTAVSDRTVAGRELAAP